MSLNHTKQKSWPQRLLALLAAVVLCAALPAAALAEENTASIQTQVSETDEDIPWADPPQSTPETGRPDPAQFIFTLPCRKIPRRMPPCSLPCWIPP